MDGLQCACKALLNDHKSDAVSGLCWLISYLTNLIDSGVTLSHL